MKSSFVNNKLSISPLPVNPGQAQVTVKCYSSLDGGGRTVIMIAVTTHCSHKLNRLLVTSVEHKIEQGSHRIGILVER